MDDHGSGETRASAAGPTGPCGAGAVGTSGRVRAFVAVVPSPQARHELAAALAELDPRVLARLRRTSPDNWHVTLAFLGDVTPSTCRDVAERLTDVAAAARPMRLALRGAGRFGDRVLWCGVDGETAALGDLAAGVAAAARASGIALDERPYSPHLTVAYGTRRAGPRAAVTALAGFTGSSWEVTAMTLFASRPGPRYTPLAGWQLIS